MVSTSPQLSHPKRNGTSKATIGSKFQAFNFSSQITLKPKSSRKYNFQHELLLPSQLQQQGSWLILFSPKAVEQIWTSSESISLSATDLIQK